MTPLQQAAVLALSVVAMSAVASHATAAPQHDAAGWVQTGEGVRTKKVALMNFDVYAISHFVKGTPPPKSKAAVIATDIDKKFVWTMLRDVEHEKIVDALREAYGMNGYGNAGKIGAFLGAFKGELKKGSKVTIAYDSAAKKTTVTTSSGSATVEGEDFMRGTWSIWFGKIDKPELGDALIKNL
jgi:hypothetical protein